MDYRDFSGYGKLLERGGDGLCYEVAVLGFSTDDEAESDERLRWVLRMHDRGARDRDFEGSWDADDVEADVRHDALEFIAGIGYEGIGELLVVDGCYDGDMGSGLRNLPRSWW